MNIFLPIKKGFPAVPVTFFRKRENGKEKIIELLIPIDTEQTEQYNADYYAILPLSDVTEQTLLIDGTAPKSFFQAIRKETSVSCEIHPTIHFTPCYGWMNDPNGLVFQDGVYHLYFQYNPFDIKWNNMCWGHAVSRDLLHWEQLDTVLYPDENGTIFSGSGIRNDHELLGLPKDALIFFYTSAGEKFTQRIAYSLDRGKTLTKLPKACLAIDYKEDRDPKVFWHEESKAYIMVLWLEKTDFGIFRSTDLLEWEQSDKITLQEAWECPDLVKVFFEEGKSRWAFMCADGYYFWGEFDGYRFQTDGVQHQSYFNKNLYAAQTYSGIDNLTISIPWLRLENDGENYTGAMGIPRKLRGIHKPESDYICFEPIPIPLHEETIYQIKWTRPKDDARISHINIEETPIAFNWKTGELCVEKQIYQTYAAVENISFLVDGKILEIFIDKGRMSGAFRLKKEKKE